MLHIMRLLESIGLKVKKPMMLECDNKGAIDICNNWTVNGRTKHIDTRHYFLRELKEKGIIESRWISGNDNSTDLFTKIYQIHYLPNKPHIIALMTYLK